MRRTSKIVFGDNAADLEQKALAHAREVFGHAVQLKLDTNYRVFESNDKEKGKFGAYITVSVIERPRYLCPFCQSMVLESDRVSHTQYHGRTQRHCCCCPCRDRCC